VIVKDPYEGYRDNDGLLASLPTTDGQRTAPEEGFFTGPEVGEFLPGFTLRSAEGKRIDLHRDRGNSKAALVFFRSVVW